MRILKSISAQLTLIVLICYLLPATVLGFYMGGTMIRDEQAKTETALLSGMEFSRLLTDQNLSRVVTLARAATYDGELDNAIAQRNAGAITDGDFLRAARGYVERKYSREPAVAFAAVFTLDAPQLLLVNRSGTDAANRYQSTAHAQVLRLGETLDTQCRFVEIGGDLYLVRNLMNLRMESYGMLVLGLDRERLLAPLLDLARGWDARLDVRLDDMDAVNLSGVSGMDEAVDWSAIEPGRIAPISVGMYACTQFGDSRDYAMRAGLLLDRRRLYGGIDGFRRLQAGLLILLVPVLGITMWYVHRRISRPIMLLSEASGRIEAGELGVTVPMHGDDELGRLGKAFTSMSLRLEELIDRTYKEQIALRDARIQAMQSRINPHFINNALESINWEARIEGSETISAMVESLSVLLNASMSRNDRRIVTLREELEVAKAYFYFVGLSYGDRLTTQMEIDDAALSATVPVLTLQPLIENAVEHGIAPEGGGGIRLCCRRLGPCLRVEVVNSGKGISPEDRRRIDAALRGDSLGGTHIGLSNICTRLRLIYGGKADIAVESDADGNTHVTLDVPQEDSPCGDYQSATGNSKCPCGD
ncbi:MAG: sensor histidine kinase [Clostridia bacterium]|nr:sensor histidine kinase [Clostridia bacterium]